MPFDLTELKRYANHRGYPEELPHFGQVAQNAVYEIERQAAEIDRLRATLGIASTGMKQLNDVARIVDRELEK